MFIVIKYNSDKTLGYPVAEYSNRKDAEDYIKAQLEMLFNTNANYQILEK